MFKYSNERLDSIFPFLTTYWGYTNINLRFKADTVCLYTSKLKLPNIKNLQLVDLAGIDSTTCLLKNMFNVYYTLKQINFISIITYGIAITYSRSFTNPVYEWYEREFIERSKFVFLNLLDTRNLLYGYTLVTLGTSAIKNVKFPWVSTWNTNKVIENRNNLCIVL